ncbi:MAG: peptidoglycan-associated lipoprotein Pal [Terracidiphilus sp.]
MDRRTRFSIPVMLLASLVAMAGCKHKIQPPVATAPPPAPAPTANIKASPTAVTAGQQIVLTWNTTNATSASIEGLGDVATSGSKAVTPSASTTYHLVARGNGGTADAYGRVTVTQPLAAAAPAPGMSDEQMFRASVKDVFFDYDKYSIRAGDEAVLSQDAAFLKNHPAMKVVIGGYCDERGSDEYNVGLGENRADSAEKILINSGVNKGQIRVISYGKEKPFCAEETESCWQDNRRAGFALDR